MQERARRTRQAILEAAAQAFAEQGYAATAMSDIATRAGVTKGALAFHFPAKGDMASALLLAFEERRSEILAQVTEEPGLDLICTVLQMLAAQFRDDVVVRAALRLNNEYNTIDAPLTPRCPDWTGSFTELYSQAAEAGALRTGLDPAALGRVTTAAFFGIQHLSEMYTGRADINDRVQEFWALFRPAIEAS